MQKKKEILAKGSMDSSAEKRSSMAVKALIALFVFMVACSMFKPTTVEDLLKTVAEKIAERSGLTVDVFRCNDYEIDRINRKLLMLCEADLK
jgi:hypothetical protein